jgi:hypothetical protein
MWAVGSNRQHPTVQEIKVMIALQRKIVAAALLRSMVTMLFVQAYGGDALQTVGATDARLAIQMNESTVDKRIALSARRSS